MKKLLLLIFLLPLYILANNNVHIYTENYPPYNYKKDGKLQGLSIEILNAMYKKMGIGKPKVTLTSWSRGYSLTLKQKNSVIFSTTRTKGREQTFKWVGPICKTTVEIIGKKDKHIKIKKIADLNKYRIGTVLKDIGEQYLLDNGIKKENLYPVSGTDAIDLSFKKLKKNRIDLFSYEYIVARFEAKEKGFDFNNYEKLYTLINGEVYFAFNKKTNDNIIKKWQKALKEIKADGTYKKIMSKYE